MNKTHFRGWRALLSGSGSAAQAWYFRIRRRLEHPEWKEVTPPSYVEIQKLLDEISALQSALMEADREVHATRTNMKILKNKIKVFVSRSKTLLLYSENIP